MPFLPPADRESRRPIDLQTDAVRLCIALQSQLTPAFLGAANDLLSCAELPPAEFRRHSRKIVRLIETTRDTLEASGISLYKFTSHQKGKWKDVYFDLLGMLQARRCDVDASLQARTSSLLIRLSSNFVRRDCSIGSQVQPARFSLSETSRLSRTSSTPQPLNSSATCITMPPPDAFPPTPAVSQFRRHWKRGRPSLRLEPFSVPEAARPHKRRRHNTDQENNVPAPSTTYAYKPSPLTKRFGIFCTGKNSMHRPRSVHAY
ncbi:hypothetical protein C8R43DRAFT_1232696 [Mycena crocata]|nr:hypothetical protein C8R43DRAFT_1232696 [Mycena crocata]